MIEKGHEVKSESIFEVPWEDGVQPENESYFSNNLYCIILLYIYVVVSIFGGPLPSLWLFFQTLDHQLLKNDKVRINLETVKIFLVYLLKDKFKFPLKIYLD